MDDNKIFFSQVQAPVEAETVELQKVKLQRTWVFWENYDAKSGKLDYTEFKKLIEKIDPDTPHKEVSSIFREVHMRIVLMFMHVCKTVCNMCIVFLKVSHPALFCESVLCS